MDAKDNKVRLSKLMSERGISSRREADEWIAKGWVIVDGKRVDQLGIKVDPSCKIEISKLAQKEQDSLVTVILNKPVGWVSSQPEDDYKPAIQLLTRDRFAGPGPAPYAARDLDNLVVTGRLDIDSQGLLVFTQDGRIAKQLIGENSDIEKEYLVRVQGQVSDEDLKLLNFGMKLDGLPLKPARVEWLNQDQLRFVLKEGKKRQIRRMCEAVGLKVIGLKRVRIGRVMLGNLPEGQWRILGKNEVF